MADSAKEKLVDFLDRHAFNPVLRANLEDYPESKHDKLKHVQKSTQSERERFHRYGSASEVVRMFKDDLNSEPAKKVHRQPDDLGLPTLNRVQPDFEALARELGVER